jgi:hypothetical protein
VSTRAVHGGKLLAFEHEGGVLYSSSLVWFFTFVVAEDVANSCTAESLCALLLF